MCGIVGIAANSIDVSKEKFFQHLLMLDTQRGPHSTGVVSVGNHYTNNEVRWTKTVGTPWDLFECKEFKEMFKKVHKVLIGHNRWATKGAINSKNAHPFQHKHIVGVHNGTLVNQSLLDKSHKFDVDSDNLFYHLSENCIDTTISKVHGAYALVWFDENTKTLNILRNNERPLYLATFVDNTGIAWASEEWMLMIAAMKCGLKLNKATEVPTHLLHQWKVDAEGVIETTEHMRKVEPYAPPVYTPKYNNNHHYYPPKQRGVVDGHIEKKELIFEVHGESRLNGNYSYTFGKVVEGEHKGDVVRIYATGTSKLYSTLRKELNEGETYFKGESAYSYTDTYLEMKIHNISTLTINPMPEGWEPEEPIIINGIVYTPEEAKAKVVFGCSYCGHVPPVTEINDCVFSEYLGSIDFLCAECAEDNNVITLMQGVV